MQQSHRYAVVTGKGYRPKTYDLGKFRYVGLLFVLLYMSLAVFLPLLVLVWLSLLPSVRMPSSQALSLVSLQWYGDIFFLIGGFEVVRNTLVLVVTTSVLVLFFSFMVSWVVVRTRLPGRQALDTIAMLPHAIPGLAFAFGLLILGILGVRWFPWLPFYNTVWIMVAANVLNRLSYGTRITNAAFHSDWPGTGRRGGGLRSEEVDDHAAGDRPACRVCAGICRAMDALCSSSGR